MSNQKADLSNGNPGEGSDSGSHGIYITSSPLAARQNEPEEGTPQFSDFLTDAPGVSSTDYSDKPVSGRAVSDKKTQKSDFIRRFMPFIKLACLAALIIGVPVLLYFTAPSVWRLLSSPEVLDEALRRHYVAGVFIYIGAQIAQVVISVIPGEAVQIAGGFIYGVWGGLALSTVGIIIGSFIAFRLARFMGREAVVAIFGEEKMAKWGKFLDGRRGKIIVFVLFLVPAMPKDMLCYAAGVSQMNERHFYLLSLFGRIPALAGSMLMGSLLRTRDYVPLIIVGAVVIILFVLAVIFREKLFRFTESIFERVRRKKMR